MGRTASELTVSHLANGTRVVVLFVPHFRVRTVRAIWQLQMGSRTSAQALLPMVLKRGTRLHPQTLELAAAFDGLYGADFDASVAKVGDAHLVMAELSVPSDAYLPEPVFGRALDLMREVVCDPALEGGHFRTEYVAQEKASLERTLEGIFNDKAQYAQMRMLETMFAGDPYSQTRFGTLGDVRALSGENVLEAYAEIRERAPLTVYAVGDVQPDAFATMASEVFGDLARREGPVLLPPPEGAVDRVKRLGEQQDVSQGKLVLGYRTAADIFDEDWSSLTVGNGIFGAFAHSKLFQNVREKASLAYSCYSRLDGFKGIMVVQAGIDPQKRDQAEEIIARQLADMQEGAFSDDEMEKTVRAMESQMLSMADSPSSLVMSHYELSLARRPVDLGERLRRLRRVTRADVIEASRGIILDTSYFLTSKGAN